MPIIIFCTSYQKKFLTINFIETSQNIKFSDITEECYDLGTFLSSKILGIGGVLQINGVLPFLQTILDHSSEGEFQMVDPTLLKSDLKASECVWKGAALLSHMPCNDSNWVTKSEYQEDSNVLFRKFQFKL